MLSPQFGAQPFDVLPDGRLVVLVRGDPDGAGSAAPSLVLVQNWDQELKRLVPVD